MFNPHKLVPNIQHSTKLKNKYFVELFYPRGDLLCSVDIKNHYNDQRDNRQIFRSLLERRYSFLQSLLLCTSDATAPEPGQCSTINSNADIQIYMHLYNGMNHLF